MLGCSKPSHAMDGKHFGRRRFVVAWATKCFSSMTYDHFDMCRLRVDGDMAVVAEEGSSLR
jgi:hypothetical protein